MIWPGEVYMADFEQAGPHPVVVISREELNRGRYVVVVACTSARYATRKDLPNCVPFLAGQFGFVTDCVAQCENVLSMDVDQLDMTAGPLGTLDDLTLRDVVRAIGYVIASDCEPV